MEGTVTGEQKELHFISISCVVGITDQPIFDQSCNHIMYDDPLSIKIFAINFPGDLKARLVAPHATSKATVATYKVVLAAINH